jgi:hypothetical protein
VREPDEDLTEHVLAHFAVHLFPAVVTSSQEYTTH